MFDFLYNPFCFRIAQPLHTVHLGSSLTLLRKFLEHETPSVTHWHALAIHLRVAGRAKRFVKPPKFEGRVSLFQHPFSLNLPRKRPIWVPRSLLPKCTSHNMRCGLWLAVYMGVSLQNNLPLRLSTCRPCLSLTFYFVSNWNGVSIHEDTTLDHFCFP